LLRDLNALKDLLPDDEKKKVEDIIQANTQQVDEIKNILKPLTATLDIQNFEADLKLREADADTQREPEEIKKMMLKA